MAGVKYSHLCDGLAVIFLFFLEHWDGLILFFYLFVFTDTQTPIYHVSFENFFKGNLQHFNTKLSSEILRHFMLLAENNADKATYNGWQANGINQVVFVFVCCSRRVLFFGFFPPLGL